MNLNDFIYEMINGRKRTKPQMLMLGILAAFVIFIVFILFTRQQTASSRKKPGPFVVQKTPPPRSLDYQIVKVDTIPFSRPALPGSGASSSPAPSPAGQRSLAPPERSAGATAREYVAPPPSSSPAPRFNGSSGGGGDMIVVSSLNQQQATNASALGGYAGLHSVRVKVILPEKTPVTNGSLVEARVMKDEVWGNFAIPRRATLLGVCNLQNNRVQIDFREIRFQGATYTCSGRAYDLKFLPGISYSPLDAKAKQIVVEELKSAAAGVPIVGRYLNQSDVNPFNDEVTTLEEGLEFYALINSIF
jgi:hypothetical protein